MSNKSQTAVGGRLKGFSALVTGASSGIGRAIALAFAAEGANVAVNYIGEKDAAEKVIEELQGMDARAIAIEADVSKEEEVKKMFKDAIKEFSTIDILVSNAGIQKDSELVKMSLGQWKQVIDVNLTGGFLCAREAAREFMRRGVVKDKSPSAGKIIFISSVHEVIPWARHCNYSASKGGVMMLMKSIAQELAPHKIRVNSIGPGAIRTHINEDAWKTKEAEAELLKLIPYDRIGEPQDISKAAVWLASDDSDYVNGSTIYIDGGMILYPGFATGG